MPPRVTTAFWVGILMVGYVLAEDKPASRAAEWSAWGPGSDKIALASSPDGQGTCFAWTFSAPDVAKPPRGLQRQGIDICEKDDPPGEWALTFRVRGKNDLAEPLGLTLGDADKSSWRSSDCRIPVRKDSWTNVELPLRRFFYAWGNDQRKETAIRIPTIRSLILTVPHGLAGTVYIDEIKFERRGDAPACPTGYPLDFSKDPLKAYGHEMDLPPYEAPMLEAVPIASFLKTDRPSSVQITKRGITLVNGQPVLPYGLFCVPCDSFAEVRRMGCNAVLEYRGFMKDGKEVKEYLDLCLLNGLMGVVDVQTFTKTSKSKKADTDGLTELVTRAKDHPALLAYYIADEPEYGDVPVEEYVKAYNAIRAVDPNHPVIMLNNQRTAIKTYAGACDILMPDPYPGFYQSAPPGYSLSEIGRFLREAQEANRPALWVTPQLHNGPCYHDDRGDLFGRTPTLAEERFMTYSAIVHGARGFLYWCYGACRWDIRDTPKYFEAVKALAAEVMRLSNVIVDGTTFDMVGTEAPIKTAARTLNDNLYIIAVNDSGQQTKARIKIGSSTWKKFHVISESRSVGLSFNGEIEDSFDPWGVHLYMTGQEPPVLSIAGLLKDYVEPYSIAGTTNPVRERNIACYLNGATAEASSTNPYARAACANNGGYGSHSRWTSEKALPQWLGITLPKAHPLGRIVLVTACDERGVSPLDKETEYELQLSSAGDNWQTVTAEKKVHYIIWNEKANRWERTETYVLGAVKAIAHSFPKTDARRLRLHFTKGPRPSIVEIEAYEE